MKQVINFGFDGATTCFAARTRAAAYLLAVHTVCRVRRRERISATSGGRPMVGTGGSGARRIDNSYALLLFRHGAL